MINLTKFGESDYDCFGGVETNDYFPDAFITWDLEYHDHMTKNNYDCVVVLDAFGLTIDISDYDNDLTRGWNLVCNTTEAIEWLKKFDNNSTLEFVDFQFNDSKWIAIGDFEN
jgi:hypothetical protein